MADCMPKKNYDLTEITRLLLEMRENCTPEAGDSYDDPKRAKKHDALNAAIDLINNPSMISRWISVKDRVPEDDKNLRFYDDGQLRFTSVLVHDENRGTDIANRLMIRHHSIPCFDELATDGWVWSRPHEPTHWMPLPELPKEE